MKLVYLRATIALINARVAERSGSYMNPDLVPSQFETLEEPQDALTVDASMTPDEIVVKIRAALGI